MAFDNHNQLGLAKEMHVDVSPNSQENGYVEQRLENVAKLRAPSM